MINGVNGSEFGAGFDKDWAFSGSVLFYRRKREYGLEARLADQRRYRQNRKVFVNQVTWYLYHELWGLISVGADSSAVEDVRRAMRLWQRAVCDLSRTQLAPSIEEEGRVVYRKDGKWKRLTLGRFLSRRYDANGVPGHILDNMAVVGLDWVKDAPVVRGDDIVEAYERAWGAGSCMTDCSRIGRIKFYANSPEAVGLLRVETVLGHRARALVWTTNEGMTVLDRIYADSVPTVSTVQQYARQQGWLVRRDNDSLYQPDPYGGLELSVTLRCPREGYPYMDTFAWVKNYEPEWDSVTLGCTPEDSYYELKNTDGDGPGAVRCAECGGLGYIEEYVSVDGYDDWVLCPQCATECLRDCAHCGYTFHVNYMHEITHGRFVCEHCRDDHTVHCVHCDDIFLCDDNELFELGGGDGFVCDTCLNELHECAECGEVRLITGFVDGKWYCEECLAGTHFRCARCGEFELKEYCTYLSGIGNVCRECRVLYAVPCEMCGQLVYYSAVRYVNRGVRVCSNCYWDLNIVRCSCCMHDYTADRIAPQDVIDTDWWREYKGRQVCKYCYEKNEVCEVCGRVRPTYELMTERLTDGTVRRVCQWCVDHPFMGYLLRD